jgi:hypothetical protein
VLTALVVVCVAAGCVEDEAGSPPEGGPTATELPVRPRMPADASTFTSARHRLRVTYPRDWRIGRRQLLPEMAPPGAILTLGTFPPRPRADLACSHSPGFPQLSVGARDALVVVEEDLRGFAWLAPDRPRRPRLVRQLRRVDPGERGREVFPWDCLNRPGISGLRALFGEAGRLVMVTAIVGERAPARVQRETLAVIQGLRIWRREHSIAVAPELASPATTVAVRVVAGTSTGVRGRRRRLYHVRVRGPSRSACVQDADQWFERGPAGGTLTARLDPRRQAGLRWCRGRFRGRITLRYGFACPRQGECRPPPHFPRHSERVASFDFEVR